MKTVESPANVNFQRQVLSEFEVLTRCLQTRHWQIERPTNRSVRRIILRKCTVSHLALAFNRPPRRKSRVRNKKASKSSANVTMSDAFDQIAVTYERSATEQQMIHKTRTVLSCAFRPTWVVKVTQQRACECARARETPHWNHKLLTVTFMNRVGKVASFRLQVRSASGQIFI